MYDLQQFALTGRVAVITGASEGIGRELAIGLADVGATIILCSRREGKLKEVQAEILDAGRQAEVFALDATNVNHIAELKHFVMKRFGKLDILINNAGLAVTRPAWDVTESDWDSMFDVGLKGVFFCCQILGGAMRQQDYGKILNISSTLCQSVVSGRSAYSAIKAGVSHLTKALAVEWAPYGIRVNALAPTAVRTPSREESLQGEVLQSLLNRIPLGRLAMPEDLVGATIFLTSSASDFVTGHTLFVDGGWVAAG